MSKLLLPLVAALCLAGCATKRGFDRGTLRAALSADQAVVTDEDVRRVLDLKQQLRLPFQLAVYLAAPAGYQDWRWSPEDRDLLQGLGDELKRYGLITSALLLNEGILQGETLKEIRLAAARTGADAVLIVRGVADNDRYNNWMGPLYIAIVTALVVPGTELESLFMTNATLWDVRNEYLYLGAEAEAAATQTRPAFYISEKTAVAETKAAALRALIEELRERFGNLR